eukprot:FR738779.1.p1 GENE.FR738779.1~~FR738779.1.p1  ORF type:complete len:161 (+),score=11.58 FR738779.1:49-483(+)
MRRVTRSVEVSKFSAVLFNNALCFFFLVSIATSTGELSNAVTSFRASRALNYRYILLNGFTGCTAFVLNFASMWCIGTTSATTYAIIGSLNKVPIALLGYIMFQTAISREGAIFVGLSMLGGFMYSHAKIMESRAERGRGKSES